MRPGRPPQPPADGHGGDPGLDPGRDEAVRVRLAANPGTAPDMLQRLAQDPRVTVRAAVALNPSAPPQLDGLLAADGDERVRTLLARKLATLIPQVATPERERIREQMLATLSGLIEDEAVRVRAAIADALKDLPQAPRALILRLARDCAVPVSEPVIRLSPLLTAEDLLALLAQPPSAATATAIARRPGLHESVSDAIAAGADSAAITALLSNSSAAIREATLDALVARAAAHEDWHGPLVRRPTLSRRAARMLSEIVATHLLEVLADRDDLDPAVTSELQQRLASRLDPAEPDPQDGVAPPHGSAEHATATARALFVRGELTEQAMIGVGKRGDHALCAAMLAVAVGVPTSVVERAATMRSAKALVSLAWAAGFSMRAGVAAQAMLGKLSPSALLRATAGGDFPLGSDEMRWQLDLLKRMNG